MLGVSISGGVVLGASYSVGGLVCGGSEVTTSYAAFGFDVVVVVLGLS